MTDSPIPPIADDSTERRERSPNEAPPVGVVPGEDVPRVLGKATWRQRWMMFPSTRWVWVSLFLLMGLAAFFRFWRISYQAYWTDESYTINRIRGSFPYMLASLSDQGFPPGWYAVLRWWSLLFEWLTGSNVTALEPIVTRSLTAIIGVLAVPAMYFLGRQFTDRKGALLVALLTAVNPYLIYYSRDIKMYMPLWLFIILNIAVFFKWQTSQKHVVWFPLYVLSGFLMTAMHSSAWFMIALQLIFLLTKPKVKPLDGLLWVVGVGAMSLLPLYWYLNKTSWVIKLIEREGDARLSWVRNYTDMSWATIASLPCSHLLGYLWPSWPPGEYVRRWFGLGHDFDVHIATRSWPWMASLQFWVAVAFAAILVLGLIPWRGLRRSEERQASVTRWRAWWFVLWLVIPPACLALTWIPTTSPWFKWVWGNAEPKPIWEPRYLGMLVPALILWLAASLRRLPTWPVRGVAIVFVLAASVFSALSNHVILRNPPFHRAAEIAMRYYDPAHKEALAVGHVDLTTPGHAVPLAYDLAAHVPPLQGKVMIPRGNFEMSLKSSSVFQFLRRVRTRPEVKTIVLTDRHGDVTDPKDGLSNESLAARLGPAWKLVAEEEYELHYEWRFYVFNTWRTRVWRRVGPEAGTGG
jgi:uncharacterized membrane protein